MPSDHRGALRGRRILVVGASSGIGRAISLAAACDGAHVAVAARRTELLAAVADQAMEQFGVAVHGIGCDIADAEHALELARRAAELLGGLDVVIYAAGSAPLVRVSDTTAEQWQSVLATNLVGAAMVMRGALALLKRSDEGSVTGLARPAVVLLSTHTVERPWPGLVAYAASKAALDALARGLRDEEPWLRVLDVAVTNTATGFADAWDPAVAGEAYEQWVTGAYLTGEILSAEAMAAVVLKALADDSGPDHVSVTEK